MIRHLATCVAFALLAPAALAQYPVFELESLVSPNAESNERLGEVLAFDDDWLCAGIPSRNGAQAREGLVVLWPRVGASLGAPVELTSPAPTSSGRFGLSLALDGDELLVGESRSAAFGSPNRSAVHRYRLQGGTWTLVDSVPNPMIGNANGFANAIARDGDLLAVGAFQEFAQSIRSGTVHLYRLVGGAWQPETILAPSDAANSDWFGASVAVSGERVLVGAPFKTGSQSFEGAAYAFELVGGAWTETGRFGVEPMSGDRGFGVSVDIDATTAIVGAARTNDVGSAYLFEDAGASWDQVERLQPDGLSNFATFGQSVAILGDRLVIGAWQDSVVGNLSGSAWVYERSAGNWTPRVRLVRLGPSAFFGYNVALDSTGSYVVGETVGTLSPNPAATGVLHLHRPDRAIGTPYCSPVQNSTQRVGGLDAFGSLDVADDQVTLLAYTLPNQAFGFFLASRAQGVVNQPGGSQGVLCLGGAIGRYVGPGQIKNSGAAGLFSLQLDLSMIPTPTGLVQAVPGETWYFQAWHRDLISGQQSSNFTNGVEITFQ